MFRKLALIFIILSFIAFQSAYGAYNSQENMNLWLVIHDGLPNKQTFPIYQKIISSIKTNIFNSVKIFPTIKKIKTQEKAINFLSSQKFHNKADEIALGVESYLSTTVVVLGEGLDIWNEIKERIENKNQIKRVFFIKEGLLSRNLNKISTNFYNDKKILNLSNLLIELEHESNEEQATSNESEEERRYNLFDESQNMAMNELISNFIRLSINNLRSKKIKRAIDVVKLENLIIRINEKISFNRMNSSREMENGGTVVQISLNDLTQLVNGYNANQNNQKENSESDSELLEDALEVTECCWVNSNFCNKRKAKAFLRLSAKVMPIIVSIIIAAVSA